MVDADLGPDFDGVVLWPYRRASGGHLIYVIHNVESEVIFHKSNHMVKLFQVTMSTPAAVRGICHVIYLVCRCDVWIVLY